MLSGVKTKEKTVSNKSQDCTCAIIKPKDPRKSSQDPSISEVQCSAHPGLCELDEDGICKRRENLQEARDIRCAHISLKSLGEAMLKGGRKKSCCKSGMSCNRKVHYYKIDLNNSEDTGLIADKQCQTCGPECSPATCSSRSREFFISWDTVRTKVFVLLIFLFILWLGLYSGLSMTSKL